MESQLASNSHTKIMKKNKGGRLTLRNFRSNYRTRVTKAMWYWHQDMHTDLQNRSEESRINPNIYGQLISTNVSRLFHGEEMVSSTDRNGIIKISMYKKQALSRTIYKNSLKMNTYI